MNVQINAFGDSNGDIISRRRVRLLLIRLLEIFASMQMRMLMAGNFHYLSICCIRGDLNLVLM